MCSLRFVSMTQRAKETPSTPQVHRYSDARIFLRDVLEWRKKVDQGFSSSRWAEELGFKSRSFLRLLLLGQRSITEASLPSFVKNLKFNRREADYFEALVRFTQARSTEVRQTVARDLARLQVRLKDASSIQDHFTFLASPWIPSIHVLLSSTDFEGTASAIRSALGLSAAEVQRCLSALERLGMVRVEKGEFGQDRYHTIDKTFRVADSLGSHPIQSFHRHSLEQALKAIDASPSERRFHAVLLPLNEKEFSEIETEIKVFIRGLASRFMKTRIEGRRLYQVHVNAVPLTDKLHAANQEILEKSNKNPFTGHE